MLYAVFFAERKEERNRSFLCLFFHILPETVTGGATFVRSCGWMDGRMASRAVFSHLNGPAFANAEIAGVSLNTYRPGSA